MTNGIEDILVGEHGIDPLILGQLTPEDVERLRAAVLNREEPYRVRAIEALVAVRPDDLREVLAQVLASVEEDSGVRAVAAANLASLGTGGERPLLDALVAARDPIVRGEIVRGLAKIGSAASLDALTRVAEEAPEGPAREQAVLARALIAYRDGRRGLELPVPAPEELLDLDLDRSVPFALSSPPPREAAAALTTIAGETYGVRLTRENLLFLECGLEQMMLALDSEWIGELPDAILRRPLVPALIARRSAVDGTYSVRWVVLTWPSEDSAAHMAVHRPSGRQVMFGRAERDEGTLRFQLRALRSPGAFPIRLEGHVENGRVTFTEALSSRQREESLTPEPIEQLPEP